MVVANGRSDEGRGRARRRPVRDLASVGAVVGSVALGVAALVSPVTSDLRSISPALSPITAPEVTARTGEVAVEIRPGAVRPQVAASGPAVGLAAGRLAAGSAFELAQSVAPLRRAAATITRPAVAISGVVPPVELPTIVVDVPLVEAPAAITPIVSEPPSTAVTSESTNPAKRGNRKAPAKTSSAGAGVTLTASSTALASIAGAHIGPGKSEASPGQQKKADATAGPACETCDRDNTAKGSRR